MEFHCAIGMLKLELNIRMLSTYSMASDSQAFQECFRFVFFFYFYWCLAVGA